MAGKTEAKDFEAVKAALGEIHDGSRNMLALMRAMEKGATPGMVQDFLSYAAEMRVNFRTIQEHGSDAVLFSGCPVAGTKNRIEDLTADDVARRMAHTRETMALFAGMADGAKALMQEQEARDRREVMRGRLDQ